MRVTAPTSTPDPSRDPAAPTHTGGRRVAPARLLAAAAGAAVVGLGLWGVANALDSEPPQEARRQAPLNVGPGASAVPQAPMSTSMTGTSTAPAQPQLPPLTIILDRPAPDGIGELDAGQQVVRLRDLTRTDGSPRRWVELGRAQLELGDSTSAETSFRRALRDGDDPAARVGLTFARFARGGASNESRALDEMARLSARYPRNQLVAFNHGWLAAYGRDAATVQAAWKRTVRLGPRTPLGRVAADLLTRIRSGG